MIEAAVDFGLTALAFVVLLTVLVFVHEMGHYLVARWCGVRVEVFSIGFGRELFGWTDRAQTRWKIAWLPLGGYVKFFGDMNAASAPDSRLAEDMSEAERRVAFHHQSLWRRVAIVFAGPFANLLYAIVVLAAIYATLGQRVTPPEIGRVAADSVAAEAGFRRGDRVLAVDGRRIDRFEEIVEAYLLNPGRELSFLIERDGRELTLTATPTPRTTDRMDGIEREIGELAIYPKSQAVVGAIVPGSAAEAAGLREGDRIVAIDGKPVESFEELQRIVGSSDGRPLRMGIERDGQRLERTVAARPSEMPTADGGSVQRWLIGVQNAPRPPVRHGPLTALLEAGATSVEMVRQTAAYLGEMIAGERGTEDLGGPLRIAHASGQAAKVGIEQLILLSVLLSLNLGLINLLPIPVLDGGHLLLYACEAVRGRPLTERMQEYAFRFGLAMILTLAIFVTWNDLVQLRVVEFLVDIF